MGHVNIDTDIDLIISRFASGDADKESFDRLREWAALSEDNRKYVRDRLEVLFASDAALGGNTFDAELGYERFLNRLSRVRAAKPRPRRRYAKLAACVAAAILLVALPLGGWWFGAESVSKRVAGIRFETSTGAPAMMTLPDGTVVWLNSGSHIECGEGFGISNRNVKMSGQACFDVARNEALPFDISSPDLDVSVLGTKFTLRNYPEDRGAEVCLMRGKVDVASKRTGEKIVMSPNERVTLDKANGRLSKERAYAVSADGWTRGELFFDEMPLHDIAKILSRRYNVKIEVRPEVGGKTFYGLFNAETFSVDRILFMLSKTGRVKYKYEDGKYILY